MGPLRTPWRSWPLGGLPLTLQCHMAVRNFAQVPIVLTAHAKPRVAIAWQLRQRCSSGRAHGSPFRPIVRVELKETRSHPSQTCPHGLPGAWVDLRIDDDHLILIRRGAVVEIIAVDVVDRLR